MTCDDDYRPVPPKAQFPMNVTFVNPVLSIDVDQALDIEIADAAREVVRTAEHMGQWGSKDEYFIDPDAWDRLVKAIEGAAE